MPRPWAGSWRHVTLRRRLVVLVVGLLAVLCVLVGALSYVAVRSSSFAQLDERLSSAAQRAARPAPGPDGTEPPGAAPGTDPEPGAAPGPVPEPGEQIPNAVSGGTIVVRLVADQVVAAGYFDPATGEYEELDAAQSAALTGLAADGSIRTLEVPGVGSVRALAHTGPGGDVVVTAMPTEQVDAAMRDYLTVSVLIGGSVLVAAAVIGTVLVRRALRPLDRVTAAAEQVSRLDLSAGEVARLPAVVSAPDADATEVGRLAGALNRMLEHVRSALNVRHDSEMQVRRFVADASHELRTPLATVRGYCELVTRSGVPLDAGTQRALERIHAEALRMGGLVEDLLLLARLDEGRAAPRTEVDAVALAVDALGDAHAAGPDHRWRLDVPTTAVVVVGEEDGLRQVLTNLLANIRQHTPPGTTGTVTVRPDLDGSVRIAVHDDGPGIAPELLPRVFGRFTRADGSRNRAAGSTGLGLAIVDAIVRAHAGTVRVTSQPGTTTFEIVLPSVTSTQERPGPVAGRV
ncbi:MAG: sensor histidine kinase [Cellulomonadaceae bacterium]